jgi:hypothetical protein
MTFDLPNESCAGQREEVPDKGYSTGYFTYPSMPLGLAGFQELILRPAAGRRRRPTILFQF